ncbi:MAG: hypothetical protein HYT80_03435 [Euryarchaeota archaeon]|nr:hypothetical protein [Euryarchaeota archaeon]
MAEPAAVEVLEGLKESFFKGHRREGQKAHEVWRGLVRLGAALAKDPFSGIHIEKRLFPRRFRQYDNLWKLNLPHSFRAIYTVLGRPGSGIRVAIEWIGDHKEYDVLFGYATS